MANPRSFSSLPAVSGAPAAAAVDSGPLNPVRHRLRAVDRDEVAPLGSTGNRRSVVDFLPPGATWLPAPQHSVPSLPGHPPMVGYLVLVPADQQLPLPAPAAPAAAAPPYPSLASEAGVSESGPVRIDPVERVALVAGRALDLTYLEFELLAHLVAYPHRVHTRDQLVTTVWGYGHVGDGRTVDVHVARLRRKLGAEHRRTIKTVRRVGYKYTP
ncbi:winged helix-turn-helix domain-containing protein [Streptomyces albipurpureus]|uniref:Winged helix-turn-helix domain-containing protein n=1 Tax=Streptomyces albipurpureus TaxID=2897419 RepID=A0ABT0UR30_9ACTN|nr:winged helix-turn-helix domain-containing protein [Streptomyces sp. CWNU-1]MCM2391057.1 winged helix-turn-helix domain-containing protein [Streptomyces sp. CWNU-1]